ncbi:MAG: FxsA family protein [Candidatus Thioglobus sp.]|nr:MAG: FxsA family protein [Candidatus Thioglobus sp.]
MLFLFFVITTTLELVVLIEVGSQIGTGNTILLIILTAFAGSFLLKQQGLSTLRKAQQIIMQGENPSFEMLEGVVILVSGILLLTPGFITDSLGLLGLIPWSRKLFLSHFLAKNARRFFTKMRPQKPQSQQKIMPDDNTIEGEFWED